MAIDRLALYTTVYPGVERFLGDWYRSVLSQTDRDFDLWVSLDSLSPEECVVAIGADPCAVNFMSAVNSTPAEIRQHGMEKLVEEYSAIVLVDSDDLLYPTRVESARAALEHHDLVGCALRIINEQSQDLGIAFGPAAGDDIEALLPRYNVFGLSNTAYRSSVLRRCLPVPRDCTCIDWLLATRAWATGAALHFDRTPRMAYRQYGANVARVLLPFDTDQIIKATQRVMNHYQCVLNDSWELPREVRPAIEVARNRVEGFHCAVTESVRRLDRYVEALNKMEPQYVWWWCVAHPNLEEIWKN